MKFITDFISSEMHKKGVVVKEFPNGTKLFSENETQYKVLHACFKPLDDKQIDKLQADVNTAQKANFVFPDWYREFFKTTNGLNIFFNSISLFGEQTPLVEHPTYGLTEALLERENPNWMAPYNLRFTNSVKFDPVALKRWLTIGSYKSDGTQIVYDFITNKIVAMYALPVTLTIKALRKMKEADYEQLIFSEWDSFEDFFLSEVKRLAELFKSFSESEQFTLTGLEYAQLDVWKKTLPKGHKEFIDSKN